MHPLYWDAGKIATEDTVRQGLSLQINQGMSLGAKAAEESVGARKEYIRVAHVVQCSGLYMMLCSTNETAEMHNQLLEVNWGEGWVGIDSQLDGVPLRPPLHDLAGDWR